MPVPSTPPSSPLAVNQSHDSTIDCPARRRTTTGPCVVALVWLAALVWFGWGATPAIAHSPLEPPSTVTVCHSATTGCDFTTIQAAVDAAGAGDVVLVSAGSYTEQLTLKSNLVVRGAGSLSTTVSAPAEPLVSANGVTSVTVEGLRFSGQAALAHGFVLTQSQVGLVDVVIEALHGAGGGADSFDGREAATIRVNGGRLTADHLTMQAIGGGDGWAQVRFTENLITGGDAIGITLDGHATLTMTASIIRGLSGGAAGTQEDPNPYSCIGIGGSAVAVRAVGGGSIDMSGSVVSDLESGPLVLA